jgi:hypothetical protein
MMSSVRNRFIALVTVGYAVLALAWIFLSDRLLSVFADIESIVWLSTVKGVLFVLVSAAGFLLALRAVPPAGRNEAEQPLLAILATGFAPGRLPPWLTYSFALAVTLLTVAVRDGFAVGFGERPLLILFMFPIILSALLGGLGPGLVATVVAALGVAYTAIPPVGSFRIAAGHDLLQWGFLIANGFAVSVFSHVLRRSLANADMNRRLLAAIVSGTSDAVFVKDTTGRYLMANGAAAAFIGRSQGEIVGRDDGFLFPEETANRLMALDRAIMAAQKTQTHEESLVTTDGRALVFLVTKGPLFDEAGRVVGLFGISRDITGRKRFENEIRDLNADLERRVAERTAELQSANRELEELAYALTHNLRAPLRAISGYVHELVNEGGEWLDDRVRAGLDQVMQANRAIGELLDGILALLRCTRGELNRERVDITALALRVFDELDRAEPQRKVAREVERGLFAVGDAVMLELAIRHLVNNAWRFTRGTDGAAIRVSSGEVNGCSGICISDNGAGFDMAHAERLFRPFQRLHRVDEFPGIGIGLATVLRIVNRHGGEIRATAAPGEGAMFCISLPPMASTKESVDGKEEHPAG